MARVSHWFKKLGGWVFSIQSLLTALSFVFVFFKKDKEIHVFQLAEGWEPGLYRIFSPLLVDPDCLT